LGSEGEAGEDSVSGTLIPFFGVTVMDELSSSIITCNRIKAAMTGSRSEGSYWWGKREKKTRRQIGDERRASGRLARRKEAKEREEKEKEVQ
jgi:hypothetical protein